MPESENMNKTWTLVQTLKTLWNSHVNNEGRTYGGTSRDLGEAKLWLQVNDWEPGDIGELTERFGRFMESTFDGWKELDYPIWAFLKHYGRYAAPRQEKQVIRKSTRYCPDCQTTHSINTPCPPQRDILNLISGIGK